MMVLQLVVYLAAKKVDEMVAKAVDSSAAYLVVTTAACSAAT